MQFEITTVIAGMGERVVAMADDFQFARMLACCASAETSTTYHLMPAKPMAFAGETFANGVSKGPRR